MRTKIFTLVWLLASVTVAVAQRHEIMSSRIGALQVMAGDRWTDMPVASLGETIHIDFDDLTHDYTRYTYKIEHCEADWTPSEELFSSDYLQGFAEGNVIDNYEISEGTYMLYTHYSLNIPNDLCRLTMSGNYRLTVMDENAGDVPVFTVCFMIVEPTMGVSLGWTDNTDADIRGRHQQIEMQLSYGNVAVTNPLEQIKTVVLQNGRWDNARHNARPQYVMNDGLRWQHCREYIFDGGNEYRKFEMLDLTHPTMGIDHISWDGEHYHVYVFPDEPRPNYIYDEDANGAFLIRNSDYTDINTTCDYALVHFRMVSPERLDGDVYLNGAWTNDRLLPEYRLEYDDGEHVYETTLWLKQGYYNYQYLLVDAQGAFHPVPSEGNFYQTENSYQALVYYRSDGDRADRLVAYASITTE